MSLKSALNCNENRPMQPTWFCLNCICIQSSFKELYWTRARSCKMCYKYYICSYLQISIKILYKNQWNTAVWLWYKCAHEAHFSQLVHKSCKFGMIIKVSQQMITLQTDIIHTWHIYLWQMVLRLAKRRIEWCWLYVSTSVSICNLYFFKQILPRVPVCCNPA